MFIMGLDPGHTNFGFSVVQTRVKGAKLQYRVMECGTLTHPMKSLKPSDLRTQQRLFLSEIGEYISYYPDLCILGERYQTRGIKGVIVELINFMLAFIAATWNNDFELITAAQWKHWVNKSPGLMRYVKGTSVTKATRDTPLNRLYRMTAAAPHELDATLIALFRAYIKGSGLGQPFQDITAAEWGRLVQMVEGASVLETTAKKARKKAVKK